MSIRYILWLFGIFCGHLVYLFPVLVCCTNKNLATLLTTKTGCFKEGCQIFRGTTYQNWINIPRWPQNLPKGHKVCIRNGSKIDRMAIKLTNTFRCKALQNFPKLGFLVWKYTIWQTWLRGAKIASPFLGKISDCKSPPWKPFSRVEPLFVLGLK
jgi:hypothetical protein